MNSDGKIFSIPDLAASLPDTADTMLTDIRLTDEEAASCRIFRVYRAVPAHFHTSCDEYLYVLSGAAQIIVANDAVREIRPGELVFFKKRTVHALPQILKHPFTVLAVDTPRRPPEDVHFVNPSDGTPDTFIRTQY
jgi:mannose-6-phosphate isomerase-like protein (cupin superfamily)